MMDEGENGEREATKNALKHEGVFVASALLRVAPTFPPPAANVGRGNEGYKRDGVGQHRG